MVNTKDNIKNGGVEEVKYVPQTEDDETQKLNPESDERIRKPDTVFLIFTILTEMLLMVTGTTCTVWASPAIIKLKSNSSDINPLGRPITTYEISMLLGTPAFISILGPLIFPELADRIGRKRILHVLGLGMFVAIIGLAFSSTIELILIFSALHSNLYTACFTVLPVYLTEICEDHNRAKYGCLMSVFISLGNLFTYVIGSAFSLRNFTLILSAPLVPFLIIFFLVPESPVYSLAKGRQEECMETLKKLRSNKNFKELDTDFNDIRNSLPGKEGKTRNNLFSLFKTKEGRTGLMLAVIPMLVRIFSGALVIMSLLAPILSEASTRLSGNASAIIIGILSLLSSIFPLIVIEKCGRKPILIWSTVGIGIFVSILGLFFFLKHIRSPIIYQIQFLPVICMSLYIILFSIGLGPIPIAISSELFLPDTRSIAVGFCTTLLTASWCLLGFVYPFLSDVLGTHWCLWMFGVCCFFGAGLMYMIIPETKGKSIPEIQEMLKNY